jgi:hypothetical protein
LYFTRLSDSTGGGQSFADKFSVVFPPVKDGSPRLGTKCMRPQDLSGGGSDPAKLLGALPARFPAQGMAKLNDDQEVRVVFWEKRVACFCQYCASPLSNRG